MGITQETRRQSYDEILETLGKRHQMVIDALKDHGPGTANEIAKYLFDHGKTATPDRNMVHPRLTELDEMELVDILGKRKCSVTGRTCAVYQIQDSENPQLKLDI